MKEERSPKPRIYSDGMTPIGQLLASKDVEAIIRRIDRNFEKFSASENDPKKHKVFWWEQICKQYYPEEWQSKKEKNLIFKKVMGQTSKFTLPEIRYIFETSFRWQKNPPALFWKLVNEKRDEIKRQIGKSSVK